VAVEAKAVFKAVRGSWTHEGGFYYIKSSRYNTNFVLCDLPFDGRLLLHTQKRIIQNLLFLAFIFLIVSETTAQTNVPIAIEGQVSTTNGPELPLEGAVVNIVNVPGNLDATDTTDVDGDYRINTTIVGMDDDNHDIKPSEYKLWAGPTPFNPHTTIHVTVPKSTNGTIKIAAAGSGQEIKTIYNGQLKPGDNQFGWDATNNQGQRVAAGVYIYYIKTPDFEKAGKMIYIPSFRNTRPGVKPSPLRKPASTNITVDLTVTPPNDSLETYTETLNLTTGIQNYKDVFMRYKNFAPTWINSINNITDLEDQNTIINDLDQMTNDFNRDNLTYSVKNLPSGWTPVVNGDQVQIQPPADWYGTINGLQIEAYDGEYRTLSNQFSITKENVNDAPIISVDNYTIDRGQTLNVPLEVDDIDNPDNELTVTAQFDSDDLEVIINNTNKTASITALRSGTPVIYWEVQDLEPLSGYDESIITVPDLNLLTIALRDTFLTQPWTNGNVTVNIDGQNYTEQANSQGIAVFSVPSGSGTITTELTAERYQTIQPFTDLNNDANANIPVIGTDLPLADFAYIQNLYGPPSWATDWHESVLFPTPGGGPDTLRIVYYNLSTVPDAAYGNRSVYDVVRDSLANWNANLFPIGTQDKYVVELPEIGKNMIDTTFANSTEERNLRTHLMLNVNQQHRNAAISWIFSLFGANPSKVVNDEYYNPNGPHYATRANIITPGWWAPSSSWGELFTVVQTVHGEIIGPGPFYGSSYDGGTIT